SCHHQALPLLALTTARARGFDVAEKDVRQQLDFTAASLARGKDGYRKGQGQGGQADTAGYALFALAAGEWKPDETTAAVAEYLLLRDKKSGHWSAVSRRPPSEASAFTTTFLALSGLQKFGTADQRERIADRV